MGIGGGGCWGLVCAGSSTLLCAISRAHVGRADCSPCASALGLVLSLCAMTRARVGRADRSHCPLTPMLIVLHSLLVFSCLRVVEVRWHSVLVTHGPCVVGNGRASRSS